ncbi:Protein phosphatase 1 regulatory subunit 3C-like protein [Emericellopsis cladophorae]|uniref:Protein phosphatase 1 regulatory subunit 3C-like protein n=1 Tax=Emericellopsis cladophorae TaxID=2686198 RepID=A0A9P9Y3U9_9HYPO|nr:Protein phosphatase 1 regulatory subunit 3C-like protein [Emericellopsis cladophorae]KAI6782610.1 Protein phosphatase 1 regulatory subunit 3C-like protein [Emericellopsis cladophorae]
MGSLTPQGTAEDLPALAVEAGNHISPSVRQSPPPRTDENGMPKGAIISPPDSASSGSDDERIPEIRGRKLDKFKELREAVNQIPQTRTPSPPGARFAIGDAKSDPSALEDETPRAMRMSFSTSALNQRQNPSRRVSHVRSATEPNAQPLPPTDSAVSVTVSEEDTDEDLMTKPQMVRKKSGELVRPALRPSSRRRPSSMPGTPVFSKAVHFDSHLEHVRHFLQVDRPLAVSAGSSPADNYESDTEYPFPAEARPTSRTPPFEWEILTPNFPHDGAARRAFPVRLEKVWLSADQKSMLGSVAVANLAFQKQVTCRFTLDYWKTTSEVTAEYGHDIRPHEGAFGYDRFNFNIKLSDTASLESKTLFFCVRYRVNGQEFWENNGGANFQVDFRKKHLPQNGKNNFQGAHGRSLNALPRSNRRQNSNSGLTRPKSMPISVQDFGSDGSEFKFDQPLHEYLGEPSSGPTGLRLKTKSCSNIASDNIAKDLSSPRGVAFANRYDFGASLSAAVQAAKDSMGKEKEKDTLYMKDNARGTRYIVDTMQDSHSPPLFSPVAAPGGSDSPVPSLPSASYEELVNKYCFFGSTKVSPPSKHEGAPKDMASAPRRDLSPNGSATFFLPNSNNTSPSTSPSANYLAVAEANKDSAGYGVPESTQLTQVNGATGGQPKLTERCAWRGDAHSIPAIRG